MIQLEREVVESSFFYLPFDPDPFVPGQEVDVTHVNGESLELRKQCGTRLVGIPVTLFEVFDEVDEVGVPTYVQCTDGRTFSEEFVLVFPQGISRMVR